MKSPGFSGFQKEFSATGREKLDGYTLANFDKMTPDEKSQAADMLAGELASFYPAADALAYLDSARCEHEIHKVLATKSPQEKDRAFHLYFVLWQITGDESHVDRIIQAGQSGNADYTALLADLAKIPSSPKILTFLEELITQHPSDKAVTQAASQLIDRYNVLAESEICNADSIELMRKFTSQSPTDKQAAFRQLKAKFIVRKV